MSRYLLAIDQGTTSNRAILFDDRGGMGAIAQAEFEQHFPQAGWVEHNAEDIWNGTVKVCRDVLKRARAEPRDVVAIGITNQRETTVVWERDTGRPICPAIVWQDRRTAQACAALKAAGHEARVTEATGLLLDPYFSATKIAWILDHVDGARARAEAGELAFGTIDSFLLYRLTGGQVHATDASNASRTLLFNIHTQRWDDELLRLFDIPAALLPEVRDNCADFGKTADDVLGAPIAIAGMAGDQQAAMIGQACFKPGMIKSTYGTGCFMMLNTGNEPVRSTSRLLTTVGYRLGNEVTYALEGSIFVAGAAVQWLRDKLQLISHASETEALVKQCDSTNGVYLVPAFTGLGAPYWDADARGVLVGLTRDSGRAEIVRATLESVAFQSRDLLEAMARDGVTPQKLRVDGGMVTNDWFVERLSETLSLTIQRPIINETTALGAAYLAGLQSNLYPSLDDISSQWACEREFVPGKDAAHRDADYEGWQAAVARARS